MELDDYDPMTAPEADDWLSLDEDERIELVVEHHRREQVELPNARVHAVIHVVVENQAAMADDVPTGAALERLVGEGLDRHEAVHAIGGVVVEFMTDLLQEVGPTEFDNDRFTDELDKLDAATWLESFE